jgi:hypothetical protein
MAGPDALYAARQAARMWRPGKDAMIVEVWFDPGCPFTWLMSRWIAAVEPRRDLDIRWRTFSLLIRNDPPETSPWYAKQARARDLLRVVEAAAERGGTDRIGDLYTEFGRRIHHRGEIDFAVEPILEELGLDSGLAAALHDPEFDSRIEASMADGFGLVGDDVGSPLIGLDVHGGRVGFNGPILTQLPTLEEGLRLWDGLVLMSSTTGFWELRRARSEGPNIPAEAATVPTSG